MTGKYLTICLFLLLQLVLSNMALADRVLDQEETLKILDTLTNKPRNVWISTGTLEAVHEQYKAPKVTDQKLIQTRIKERIEAYNQGQDRPEMTDDLRKMRLDAIPFNIRYRLANEQFSKSTILVRCDGEKRYTEINMDSRTDSIQPTSNLKGNFETRQFNMDWNAKKGFSLMTAKITLITIFL